MKPKAKTLAERYGFRDPDLKTKSHDKIMMWLTEKEHVYDVLNEVGVIPKLSECYHSEGKCFYGTGRSCNCPFDDNGNKIKEKTYRPMCPFSDEILNEIRNYKSKLEDISVEKEKSFILSCMPIPKTEYVVMNRSGYVVIGFIDVRVELKMRGINVGNKFVSISCENPLYIYYLEVKSKIDSFGDTMRQLNMYREFISGPVILVVPTLSTQLRNAFESQGIKVFTTRSDVGTWFE